MVLVIGNAVFEHVMNQDLKRLLRSLLVIATLLTVVMVVPH